MPVAKPKSANEIAEDIRKAQVKLINLQKKQYEVALHDVLRPLGFRALFDKIKAAQPTVTDDIILSVIKDLGYEKTPEEQEKADKAKAAAKAKKAK